MPELIYGKNPVLEAFRAGRRKIFKFHYVAENSDPQLKEAFSFCEKLRIPANKVGRGWLESQCPGALTQGWAADVSDYPYVPELELAKDIKDRPGATVLALDQIQDPQNVGALLRTAEAAGVDGVLIPENRSGSVTPAVGKSSAGAIEYLKIARVTNLARALATYKEAGFWVVGTSAPTEAGEKGATVQNALTFDWPDKTLLVLGAEGTGMRRLTVDSCDFLIHLPLAGRISSLNVSVAGAVCMYERIRNKRI